MIDELFVFLFLGYLQNPVFRRILGLVLGNSIHTEEPAIHNIGIFALAISSIKKR